MKFRLFKNGVMDYDPELIHNGRVGLNEQIEALQESGELMRSTGLRDRQGKEIYEGDLVKIGKASGVAKIVFSYKYAGGWLAESEGETCNIGTRTDSVHVVGNIYEGEKYETNTRKL